MKPFIDYLAPGMDRYLGRLALRAARSFNEVQGCVISVRYLPDWYLGGDDVSSWSEVEISINGQIRGVLTEERKEVLCFPLPSGIHLLNVRPLQSEYQHVKKEVSWSFPVDENKITVVNIFPPVDKGTLAWPRVRPSVWNTYL